MPAHPWLGTSPVLLLKAVADVPPLDEWLRKHAFSAFGEARVSLAAIKKHKAVYLMAVGGAAYLVSKAIRAARVVVGTEARSRRGMFTRACKRRCWTPRPNRS